MFKFVFIIILFIAIGAIFAPYLPQVFGAFGTGFTTITTNSSDLISFLISLFTTIFSKPYIMQLVGVLIVFAVIGLIIDVIKGGK